MKLGLSMCPFTFAAPSVPEPPQVKESAPMLYVAPVSERRVRVSEVAVEPSEKLLGWEKW